MTRTHTLLVLLALAVLAACGGGGHDHGRAGDLDSSFADDGAAVIDFGATHDDRAQAVTVQPDGRILVAATSCDELPLHCAFALARVLPDGTSDASFGTEGRVTTNFGPIGGATALALALQPDGRIVLAGYVQDDPHEGNPTSLGLARYLPDGNLDSSFGDGGRVITRPRDATIDALSGQLAAVSAQPDGSILAAGTFFTPSSPFSATIAVMRYHADGTLDRSFGSNGFATPGLEQITNGYSLVVQSSGRIVVAGSFDDGSVAGALLLAGFDAQGRLDPTFGDRGLVTSAVERQTFGDLLATNRDDDLIAAAGSELLRFDADGRPAPGFDHHALPGTFIIRSLAVNDGRLVVAGSDGPIDDAADSFALARLHGDGTLDPTFGRGGLATNRVGFITDDIVSHLTLQSDGRIVVATTRPIGENADLLLFRHLGEP